MSLEIVHGPGAPPQNMIVQSTVGKISGTTLAQTLETFPLGTSGKIHTYDVVGPEFSLVVTGGPANANVPIQAWVFLH